MNIKSTVFEHNGNIPTPYTCDGSGTNPPLAFEDVPDEAQSLVLIMEDPDVPQSVRKDGMWDHWLIFNMSPFTTEIPEGHETTGILGAGTNGKKGYLGPCPPDKEHRYFFKLFALDTILELPEGAPKKLINEAMQGHIIAKADLVGRYERKF